MCIRDRPEPEPEFGCSQLKERATSKWRELQQSYPLAYRRALFAMEVWGVGLFALDMVTDALLLAWLSEHGRYGLSLIHISEPTRLLSISYAVFCLKKKKHTNRNKNNSQIYKLSIQLNKKNL
eukprot:TRINITY_DN40790_c0_g1_i1.p1 TRINITY_DN40790_c0_g1~~TRINITY_DN40790_c0_g1_i1.p1  ORF type:complete len:123 (+),score=32.71 TRINITY_DN40790_c0_g1_i1:143-511(+)